jgi:2'-5' RNA ligase
MRERDIYEICQRLEASDDLPLRWVPADSWHVTLVFLGEVSERSLGTLVDAVTPLLERTPRMQLALTHLGWFPSAMKPRLLVLHAEPCAPLMQLHSDLAAELRREGFHSERREYRPHLTLARLQGSRKQFNPPALPPIRPLQLELSEVVLFESVPGGHSRDYKPLHRFGLGR